MAKSTAPKWRPTDYEVIVGEVVLSTWKIAENHYAFGIETLVGRHFIYSSAERLEVERSGPGLPWHDPAFKTMKDAMDAAACFVGHPELSPYTH